MGSNENTWNLMAGLAMDQMLERNENGNLYPLTSMEITVLTDIREMLHPSEPEPEPIEDPKIPEKKQSKPQTKETHQKKDSFHGLNSEDLT